MTRVVEEIGAGGVRLVVERPADPEALLDEERFADDEYLPYWAEVWPSGLALADAIPTGLTPATRVLEVGCGLGLPSLVAAARGASVTATDWAPEAIDLLRANAARNGLAVDGAVLDWRDAPAHGARGPFDLVLAADVLYEARNAEPLAVLLEALGAPALVADPGRRHADAFLVRVRASGARVELRTDDRIPRGWVALVTPPGA